MPPHVVTGDKSSTDVCAMCHRAHTATTSVPHATRGSNELTGSSLLASSETTRGDVPLCYSCHGTGQLGSDSDIETGFAQLSSHSMTPSVSPYGRGPKVCSTCHDSHGSERTASGTPYPALLRSFEGTRAVVTGEAYCATCHTVHAGERWDGLVVFEQTSHFTSMPVPASGTGIRCSVCHAPHGSPVAPLLVSVVGTLAAPATRTITADDRGFCVACHPVAAATWSGETTYATSAHSQSATTVPIATKWVPAGSQRVGECQVCHAAMGSANASGGAIPKLLEKSGRALCDDCHRAGGAAASTDTSSEAYPTSESGAVEVVAAYPSGDQAPFAGRVSVYGRALSGVDPRGLIGPRQYVPADGTGPSAAGDIDADGHDELVVASTTKPILTVYSRDPFTGLSSVPATSALPTGSRVASMAIANVVDFLGAWTDRPEIVVVTTAGQLIFYQYSATSSILTTVAGPVSVGVGPWGLATGDATGTSLAEAVVTDRGGAEMVIVTDDKAHDIDTTTVTVGVAPVAPVVGNVWAGVRRAIVVADANPATDNVHVLDGDGRPLADYAVTIDVGDGVPVASAVGDVLLNAPEVGRDELALAFVDASGDSTVVAIPQPTSGSGLATTSASAYRVGARTNTGVLVTGDVEGDGRVELLAGNAGTWAIDGSAVAPSFDVIRQDGPGRVLASSHRYVAGGTEMAGRAPSLVVADFGPVLPSRHPIDEAATGVHVSTETISAARHVTCADCHNSHEATSSAVMAPAVQGPLKGAWGVTVGYPGGDAVVSTQTARSTTSYGVCLKCHSADAGQFDPGNVSGHAIIETGTPLTPVPPTTFVGGKGLSSDSVLYCTDCHGKNAVSGSHAPHTSTSWPILVGPYAGAVPDDDSLLCYSCHAFSAYASSSSVSTASLFVSDDGAVNLHIKHVSAPANGHGLSCSACHVSHGSAGTPRLLRGDIGFERDGANSCTNDCHSPARKNTYGAP